MYISLDNLIVRLVIVFLTSLLIERLLSNVPKLKPIYKMITMVLVIGLGLIWAFFLVNLNIHV